MGIAPTLVRQEIHYPESDGQPMAETLLHIYVISYLLAALTDYFRLLPDVYVGANNLIYYEEGEPSSSFAPDVYLIRGLDKTPRRVYRLWIEKRIPSVIFEITSRKTWMDDLGSKRVLYAKLGVQEYFIYDVEGQELDPVLQGFRLAGRDYVSIEPDENGYLWSEELGLAVLTDDETLRLFDPGTNQVIATPAENYQTTREALEEAREAELRAEQEHQARVAAEVEVARLRAEIEKLRGKQD